MLNIILVYGQPRDRKEAKNAGFDDHLVKPVQLEELNDRLGELRAERDRAGSKR